MLVRASAGQVVLEDAQNLKALSLILDGDPEAARASAATLGQWVDQSHLAVPAHSLVALAGQLGQDAQWREDFDAMIAYAATKGWVDDEGRVQMHVSQR